MGRERSLIGLLLSHRGAQVERDFERWSGPTFCSTGSLDEINKLWLQSYFKTSSDGNNDFCVHHFSVLPCILSQVLSFAVSPRAAFGLLPSFWWSQASWGRSCLLIQSPVAFLSFWGIYLLFTFSWYLLLLSCQVQKLWQKWQQVNSAAKAKSWIFKRVFQLLGWQTGY